jgi:ADP-L-glycero-D-manno-heptose 6-epimerase
LQQAKGFDFIFHQAAISDTTTKDQNLTMQTNLEAFKQLLKLTIESEVVLVYASSGATYGNAAAPQTVGRENPGNVYGFSKLMMDKLAEKHLFAHPKSRVVGLRYFNVYGPNEYFKGTTASMVLQFGLQILGGQAPKLFEGSDRIRRDFIYIEDIIQANIKAAITNRSGTYNVGTGKARSFQEVADVLQIELGTSYGSQYIPNPYASQYQFLTEANIENTKQMLQYEPYYTLEQGIQAYLPEIKRIFKEEHS